MNIGFYERRKFFDTYGGRPHEQQANLPSNCIRLTCPCCGYPTLMSFGDYDICQLCNWEDDGQDEPNADEVWGGPNHSFSLTQARANFEQYLVMYPPDEDSCVGAADTDREKEIKYSMITAFEQMMRDPSTDELNALWGIVGECEQALHQELKVRVSGPLYEAVPCPYCGKPLRTRLAKQCRHCHRDWHGE